MTYNDTNTEYETEKNSSIKLSKTSTGKYSWDIKLYFDLSNDEDLILERINRIHKKMEVTYKNG